MLTDDRWEEANDTLTSIHPYSLDRVFGEFLGELNGEKSWNQFLVIERIWVNYRRWFVFTL
jgi:hypothetical protein